MLFTPNNSGTRIGGLTLEGVRDYDIEGKHSIQNVQLSVPNHWAKDKEFRTHLLDLITQGVNDAIRQQR